MLPQVDGHIEDLSPQRTHQLGLTVPAALIVQTAQDVAYGLGFVFLHKVDAIPHPVLEVGLAPRLHEIAAVVGPLLGFHDPYVGDCGMLCIVHCMLYFFVRERVCLRPGRYRASALLCSFLLFIGPRDGRYQPAR